VQIGINSDDDEAIVVVADLYGQRAVEGERGDVAMIESLPNRVPQRSASLAAAGAWP